MIELTDENSTNRSGGASARTRPRTRAPFALTSTTAESGTGVRSAIRASWRMPAEWITVEIRP